MKLKDLDDSLILIYDYDSKEPLGTGFFVNTSGHFITAYHVVLQRRNIKETLRCKWKGKTYRIQYEPELRKFYDSQKNYISRIDLTVLKIDITNESVKTEPVATTPTDFNDEILQGLNVNFKGFSTRSDKKVDNVPLACKVSLSHYQKENGVWLVQEKDIPILEGFSGSPVLNPSTGEVMGIVAQRSEEGRVVGAIQSLHMLADKLIKCGCEIDTFFPLSNMYREYHDRKKYLFEMEGWPYAVAKEDFVDSFDLRTLHFSSNPNKGEVLTDVKCAPFIINELKDHPVFCVGYYGMGKTTISKFLFTNYSEHSKSEYPIFVALWSKHLPRDSDELDELIESHIISDFNHEKLDEEKFAGKNPGLILKYFQGFLKSRKIVLILDGIDEAICDGHSLGEFAQLLKSQHWTYFLTSRSEFHAFFDKFKVPMKDRSHLVIELMLWDQKQWQLYTESLFRKFPEKSHHTKRFVNRLENREYGNLPERPLFLKMISDLELDNKTNLEIPQELISNRAQIYHAYIKWKILDDFERKGETIKELKVQENSFRKDCFRLFQELANIEYKMSVSKIGAVDLFEQNDNPLDMYDYAAFTMEDIRTIFTHTHFDVLDSKFVNDHLFGSTLFSTIRREIKKQGPDLFRFSHKSFCEYLFAFNLADSILGGAVEKAECGQSWRLYQTHEVSTHFQDEIKRLCYKKRLSKQIQNEYLRTAFEKVLLPLKSDDLKNYSEMVEEVLYYTGQLKVNSVRILDVLKKIAENPSRVDRVYYRTAHLSLSLAVSEDYCMKYVEYLIESYHNNKEAFQLNSAIQIYYYGKATLHTILKEDTNNFINKGKLEGIIPLEIFSYFTCIPFDATEISKARDYLGKIRRVCDERGHIRLKRILDDTQTIMDSVSRVN